MGTESAESWDRWWQTRLSEGTADVLSILPAPIACYKGRLTDPANSDDLLLTVMAEHGLRTVLCAGNGVSQEPRALAEAGCAVTALDISPVATRFAEAFPDDPRGRRFFCSSQLRRPGGSVEFVGGDLLDVTVCPGPFDVVIERRTVQVFSEQQRAAALSALSKRLGSVGVFLSLCLDDPFPRELGWSQHDSGLFHASESWFREQGWAIWDGVPSFPLAEQVAWLVRCGSMKQRPSRKEGGKVQPV
jgi:hypothetical protein